MQASSTMDSSTTPYTIVVNSANEDDDEEQQWEAVPALAAVQEAWEQTSTKVQEAWDAVTHQTATKVQETQRAVAPVLEEAGNNVRAHVEQTQRAVGPAFEQAGNHVRTQVAAVSRSASDLGQAAGDNTRALSMATTVAALTTWQATKQYLASIGSNPLAKDATTGETVVKGEDSDAAITSVALSPVAAVAAVGLISGLVSFFMIAAQLVDLASLTLIVSAPYVAYQKWQLASLGGMRGQQNRLRTSANRLSTENSKLTGSVDQLERQVRSLNQVEKKLSALAAKRGTQVDKLVQTVHENGQLLLKIKAVLEASVMNQLISSIVLSDHDRDFCLSPNEVQNLIVTLSCLPGVQFDETAFQRFIDDDADDAGGKLTLNEVLNIIHQLKDDTVQDTDKVFTFHPKDVLKQL